MYSVWFDALLVVVLIWLGAITFLIWQQKSFLKSIFPKDGKRDIRAKFEELLGEVEVFRKDLGFATDKLSELEIEGLSHIQKVELIRYNPYDETGGDQSFTAALLDERGNGFLITSLHARSGTRMFAKPIVDGKSTKYKLSEEEEEVIKKAMSKGKS